jgi:NADH:ubiquinone oxidoreductase subunit F (NADH-binding)
VTAAIERGPVAGGSLAGIGDDAAILLGGPPQSAGAETLVSLHDRLGALPQMTGADLGDLLEESGLSGRGGGQFPFARKLATVRGRLHGDAPAPAIVVNVSESEPASRKDRTLARLRPHLVLDGAALVAQALRAREVVLHLHDGEHAAIASLRVAIGERAGADDPHWRLSTAPAGYVSGESSAVLSAIEGGPALPRWSPVPAAVRGLHGRPTLLSNAETFAQIALLARLGAAQWKSLGPNPWAGPLLLTVHGAVPRPGEVVEVVGPATVGDVLEFGDVPGTPAAVLVGGYAGTWVTGAEVASLALDRASLAAAGASLGCGVLGVLPTGHCGLAETARLVRWLADESAGQCGPCAFGLPRMGSAFEALAAGRGRAVDALLRLAAEVDGRGGCRHPDGVARLARSAVTVFADDVRRHRWGRTCAAGTGPLFPLPARGRAPR